MTHPVPAYLYILQGDLTVQFADGRKQQRSTRVSSSAAQGDGTVGAMRDNVPFAF